MCACRLRVSCTFLLSFSVFSCFFPHSLMSSHGSNKKVPIDSVSEFIRSGSIDLNLREDNVESWPASKTLTPRLTTNKSVAFLKFQNNPQNIIKNLMTNLKASNKPLLLLQVTFCINIHTPSNFFLILKIEEFIQYELNRPVNRRFDKDKINESRLEVFRECFDVLISEFSTYQVTELHLSSFYPDSHIHAHKKYQPVLTQIKNEYESVIAQCLKKVHQVRIIEVCTLTNIINRVHIYSLRKRQS